MKAFREAHNYPPMFPFLLSYQQLRTPDMDIDYHFHDWYEIVYVHEGEGSFFIHRSFFDMQAGDLFAIPGELIHKATINREHPYTVSVVLFNPALIHRIPVGDNFSYLEFFHSHAGKENFRLTLRQEQRRMMEQYLNQMHRELEDQQAGYRHAILTILHRMLIDMNRIHRSEGSNNAHDMQTKSESWMKEILIYIDTHIEDDLSLPLLAGQALVSPSHFSRVFKRLTGFRLPDYLKTRRIMLAKELILKSDQPIAYIAERCGFESVSHFHRTFKAYTATTPGEFRLNNQRAGDAGIP